jgi:hypothetical protein
VQGERGRVAPHRELDIIADVSYHSPRRLEAFNRRGLVIPWLFNHYI